MPVYFREKTMLDCQMKCCLSAENVEITNKEALRERSITEHGLPAALRPVNEVPVAQAPDGR
jgi:hypothetical protein